MGLAGCFMTPHPPIIVPEVGRERVRDAQPTFEAMRRLSGEAKDLAPDAIVIMSPHAALDADRMGVGLAVRYSGSLAQFGAPQVTLDFSGEVSLAQSILREAEERGVPARAMTGGRDRLELDHGCQVPLVFIVAELDPLPALVVVSFSFLPTDVHHEFGKAIGAALDATPQRVLFVASGDLSHRLTRDAPAGYSLRGAEFDKRVVTAFTAGDARELLTLPADLQYEAGECGYRSMVTLFGLLEGRAFSTRTLSYEGPFGVGYLVGAVDMGIPVGAEAPR
jgi:aromatic ring-opening dioxygenase LigB subunit